MHLTLYRCSVAHRKRKVEFPNMKMSQKEDRDLPLVGKTVGAPALMFGSCPNKPMGS